MPRVRFPTDRQAPPCLPSDDCAGLPGCKYSGRHVPTERARRLLSKPSSLSSYHNKGIHATHWITILKKFQDSSPECPRRYMKYAGMSGMPKWPGNRIRRHGRARGPSNNRVGSMQQLIEDRRPGKQRTQRFRRLRRGGINCQTVVSASEPFVVRRTRGPGDGRREDLAA